VNWSVPFDELSEASEFASLARRVDESDVMSFAALTGDMHPQHVDREWAAAGPFGERIAHGMLVLSYAVGLTPFDPEYVVALRRVREVVFKRPVRLGEEIHVRGRVAELRALDEHSGLVGCRLSIVNHSEQLCARAQLELLWRREPALRAV
jgi:acyl dehydratase